MQAETPSRANLQKITIKFFHNADVKVRRPRMIGVCKPVRISGGLRQSEIALLWRRKLAFANIFPFGASEHETRAAARFVLYERKL